MIRQYIKLTDIISYIRNIIEPEYKDLLEKHTIHNADKVYKVHGEDIKEEFIINEAIKKLEYFDRLIHYKGHGAETYLNRIETEYNKNHEDSMPFWDVIHHIDLGYTIIESYFNCSKVISANKIHHYTDIIKHFQEYSKCFIPDIIFDDLIIERFKDEILYPVDDTPLPF